MSEDEAYSSSEEGSDDLELEDEWESSSNEGDKGPAKGKKNH
jgi:hypothetical protein